MHIRLHFLPEFADAGLHFPPEFADASLHLPPEFADASLHLSPEFADTGSRLVAELVEARLHIPGDLVDFGLQEVDFDPHLDNAGGHPGNLDLQLPNVLAMLVDSVADLAHPESAAGGDQQE